MNFSISLGVTSFQDPSEQACVGFSKMRVHAYLLEFPQMVSITSVEKKQKKEVQGGQKLLCPASQGHGYIVAQVHPGLSSRRELDPLLRWWQEITTIGG